MRKEAIREELYTFLFYFLFFAFFFCTLTLYRQLILDEYALGYIHYGYGLFEALILAKMVLLGEKLNLGKRFEKKPLAVTVIFKTVIFLAFVLAMTVGEHFLIGMLKGHSLQEISTHLLEKGVYEILAQLLACAFVFVLFFAFVETGRILGKKKLYEIFFISP